MSKDLYLGVDSEGVPFVQPDPITTPDIEVCSSCGCMEITHPEQAQMFPGKDNVEATPL